MANKKSAFGVINDGAGAGLAITKAIPGTTLGSAIAVTAAMPAFVNSSGVLVFPQLNADGAILVSTEETGACFYAVAKLVGSTSFQTTASYTGAIGKVYKAMSFVVSSMTECDWELVYVNGAVETILAYFDTGPGQYSFCCELSCVEVDTGAGVGVQQLIIRGKLLEATGSEIAATLNIHEQSA